MVCPKCGRSMFRMEASMSWWCKDCQRQIPDTTIRMGSRSRKSYRVSWEIDLDAANPREAAQEALRIMRDPKSIATVFYVIESDSDANTKTATIHTVDLGAKP